MAGISINFLADVKNFLRGTKNVEDELENVADSLDDMAKDGDKAAEKIEKSFRELARETKQTGDTMSTGMKGGFDKTRKHGEDAATEIKDEFKSNLSEVTSSFDGSVESMGDLVQGTLGGLVGSLGPLGVAAGAAGAAGVGLLIAEITKAAEEAEKSKERIRELGLALIEEGEVGGLEYVNEQLRLIVTNSDDAPIKLEEIRRILKDFPELSVGVGDLAEAFSGNRVAIEASLSELERLLEAEEEQLYMYSRSADSSIAKRANLEAEIEVLRKVKEETEAASRIEADWADNDMAWAGIKAEHISQIDAAYDDAVNSVDNFINKETGILDITAYAESIEQRKTMLLDYQNALAVSGLSGEAIAQLNQMGVEQASQILAGLQDPNIAQETKDTVINGLEEASREGSGQARDTISKEFEVPFKTDVQVTAQTAKATEAINDWINKPRYVDVIARIRDEDGRSYQ